MRKILFLFILAVGLPSFAQESEAPAQQPKRSAWGFNSELLLWNENISVEEAGLKSEYKGQFPGLSLGFEYRQLMGSNRRWLQSHAIDFMGGGSHITGTSAGGSSDLRGQIWYGGGLSLGFVYRTTDTSEVRFGIPLMYRALQLKNARPEITFVNKSQFVYGFEFSSGIRVSQTTTLSAGMATMKDFPSSIWKLGWMVRL